jgi:mRNA interferase MazF
MNRLQPGDVATVDFPGATGMKRRPAVVLSNRSYHVERPDVILGILTTNVAVATSSFDYLLQDWRAAGLNAPSAFRSYLGMASPAAVRKVGHVSDRDWSEIRDCVRRAFA